MPSDARAGRPGPVGRLVVAGPTKPIRGVTIRAATQAGGYAGFGAGGSGPRRVRRAGAVRDPGHRRGDDDPASRSTTPSGGTTLRNCAAEPDPGAGGPDDRGRRSRCSPTVPRFQGVVREKGTERPIAGDRGDLGPSSSTAHPVAVTDASGTFRGFVGRRGDHRRARADPRARSRTSCPVEPGGGGSRGPAAPRRRRGRRSSPIELRRGVDVPGTVAGGGRQAGRRRLSRGHLVRLGRARPRLCCATPTDPAAFVLHGIDPRSPSCI